MAKLLRLDNRTCTPHCFSVLDSQPDDDAAHLAVWREHPDGTLMVTRVVLFGAKLHSFVALSFGRNLTIDTYKANPRSVALDILSVGTDIEAATLVRSALSLGARMNKAMRIRWFRTTGKNIRMGDCAMNRRGDKELSWGRRDEALAKLSAHEAANPVSRPDRGIVSFLEEARKVVALKVHPEPVPLADDLADTLLAIDSLSDHQPTVYDMAEDAHAKLISKMEARHE